MTIGFSDPPLADFLSENLRLTFGVEVGMLECPDCLDFAFSPGRKQYSSEKILRKVLDLCPEDAVKIIGVVNVDLYIPVLTFVFGQAQLGGRAGLVSISRLSQKFYDLPEKRNLLYIRTLKEILHELGHTYSLIHCQDPSCIMSQSYTIRNIDRKSAKFCFHCRNILSRGKETE